MTFEQIITKIQGEVEYARGIHPRFNSHHEAYAVILEELEEWWDSVKADTPDDSELISVAAMAIQTLIELSP